MLKNQRGGAAVEFAIVLPLLALILFGTIDFALLFYDKQILTNASREVARSRIVKIDPDNLIDYEKIAVEYCKNLINLGNTAKNALDPSKIEIDDSVADYISVSISYDYEHFFTSFLGIESTTITGKTIMRQETF
ncbi:TadE/TadG family type IV pilus assembly protein [Desulfobacula phenolica]|uniref:TadE-like protein n=1 Tax=Desulfobacula phenolica TaxID=90732 RepID=A0A1H2ES01_9BACT|nr:TadE family protein [Desulfobacula phenolica]SDT97845.1 TadE-like protein [Desulfobacula phenolica]